MEVLTAIKSIVEIDEWELSHEDFWELMQREEYD